MENLNDLNEGWSSSSYWGDMVEEEFRACTECVGDEEYKWMDDRPEVCTCDEYDGVDEEGRIMITKRAMMKLRRCRWEQLIGWDEQDLVRRIEAKILSQRISRTTALLWW